MKLEILLDCDGVLADFHKAAAERHGKSPEINTWWFWQEEWHITTKEFWDKCRGRDFWENMDLLPWATELYHSLYILGNVTICTAPSNDDECAAGKHAWLRKHFGLRPGESMVTARKYLTSGRINHILIDDSPDGVEKFQSLGGRAILFPRSWNDGVGDWKTVIKEVADIASELEKEITHL